MIERSVHRGTGVARRVWAGVGKIGRSQHLSVSLLSESLGHHLTGGWQRPNERSWSWSVTTCS